MNLPDILTTLEARAYAADLMPAALFDPDRRTDAIMWNRSDARAQAHLGAAADALRTAIAWLKQRDTLADDVDAAVAEDPRA